MATEFDDDDDGEFGGFEMADAPHAAEAQPLPPSLQVAPIVQPSLPSSQPESHVERLEDQHSQANMLAATSVVADGNGVTADGPLADEPVSSFVPMQTMCPAESAPELLPPHLNVIEFGSSSDVQLEHCRVKLHQYEQKYAELQQQRSTEMKEMHQRTRTAVDSVVHHYQRLLNDTVRQCEEDCKQQVKEAVERERASLADVIQQQKEEMSRLMEERSSALEVRFDECLAEQRLKQQEIYEELRQEERRQSEEHIKAVIQEKDGAIKQAIEYAVQLEQNRSKQTVADERELLLKLVHEEREKSQKAVEELMVEERLKHQQSMEKTLREYQNQIDTMMSRALQLAQEQIKVYVDEQRRDDDAARLRLLSSVDVLLDTARTQLQQLIFSPDHLSVPANSAEH